MNLNFFRNQKRLLPKAFWFKQTFRGILSFFAIFLLLALGGCQKASVQKESAWWENNHKLKVLTSIAMINDLVKEIGGEDVDTIALIRGELDPHSYELVKGDDEKFARADLIFYNGLGLEHGLSLRLNLEGNSKAVALGDILLKENPSPILLVDGQYDPHIWMDIALWMKTIDPIVTALSQKDPMHAENYQARASSLKTKMQQADLEAYHALQSIASENRYLVTSHDAFHYFTRHYLASPEEKSEEEWRHRCAAPEGLAPDAHLSVTDIQEIISHVDKYKISVLFPEANVNKDSLRKIVSAGKEKGFTIRLCKQTLYGDSMGTESYLEMINHNVKVISQGLKGDL